MDKISRRSLLGGGVAFATLTLAACGNSTTNSAVSSGSTSTAGASTTTSGSAAAVAATTAGTTSLTSGSATVSVNGSSVTYQAAYLVDGVSATVGAGTFASTTSDQVAFLVVNGGSLTIDGSTISKSGDGASKEDNYNFYGTNSAVVVVGSKSTVTVKNASISTAASGANAIVAVGGGTATVSGTKIATTKDSSRGLHATNAGVINAKNMTISTLGAHCADVATDRGGGTVTVTGTNRFSTAGDGSPLVYSTGTINVSGVTGTAGASEIVVIEGKNAATITNSTVTSKGNHALMIYQSFSGDAADKDASSTFGAVTLTKTAITHTGSAAAFYFTNTTAKLTTTNVTLTNKSGALASAQEDRWGTSGSNGAAVTWLVDGSKLTGSVIAGSSSSIKATLSNSGSISGSTSGSVSIA